MSLSAPKKNIRNSKSTRINRKIKKNEKFLAIDDCKRLYQKYYSYPSTSLLNQLNENILKLYLEKLTYKDISVISMLLSKYYYFQQIEISMTDPNKSEPITTRKSYRPIILSKEEKSKIEKEKKIKIRDTKNMINKLIISISNHLANSNSIISLSLNKIELNQKYCEILSKGISKNNSLQSLSITDSKILLNSYELILESLLNHNLLYYLDLSNNNFDDKYGKMISRIIIRQFQRRDQIVWSYGLRNEIPLTNDYKKGLIYINLNGNNLSKDSADSISNALYSDLYIRAIYLNNNKFDNYSCKKFIYMMRNNLSILTIDLRGNPGYDNYIHSRLVMKMSKNIRYLYQQYKKGEYSEEEFENFKIFIDVSFFDVDIPQNVVEFYNNNLPENLDENENNENKISNENIKTDIEEKKIITNVKEGGKEKYNKYNDDFKNLNINNKMNKSDKSDNIIEENKKLYNENLRLKKQIIELKAINLQKKLNGDKNPNKNISNKNNINTTNNNNESNNESKSDIENDYQKIELLISELNDLMNKIEKKKSKQKSDSKKKDTDKVKDKEKEIIIENKNEININNKENITNITNINNIKNEENIHRPEIKEIITEVKEKEDNKIINLENKNIKNNNEDISNEENKSNNNNNIINSENKKKENEDLKDIYMNIKKDEETKNNENEIKKEIDIPYQNAEPTEEKDKESNDSHYVDENGNVFNFDDLSEEEKMIILQQQLILQRLQEEAEARGEQFDPQEYIEFLERQANEEEEGEDDERTGHTSNKLNKSL